ncbi:MAG: ATP-binding protein [Sandaracinaceae bacterium]|nr:ATP-binding protein [Sandaracinaceae bacterium]
MNGPAAAVGLGYGSLPCACTRSPSEPPVLVAVTGGPGAGKTAALEMARRSLCRHAAFLPEAASIVFGGGFPRYASPAARRAAQRAIFAVQRQLERLVVEEGRAALIVCDRGTLDGLAYWPDDEGSYWQDVGSSPAAELARYAAVVHLQTPGEQQGYVQNGTRIESAAEARAIDERIAHVWSPHPRRCVIASEDDFFEKVRRALGELCALLPECCRARVAGE